LVEKLEKKDQLLRDYEMDLAKLRQAEFLLQKKSEQLDDTQIFSISKEDEIEYMKESMKKIKLELEREKMINSSIKQKKDYSSAKSQQPFTERVRRTSTDKLHHHCPPGNDFKAYNIKKIMDDKIKRKEYELNTLKKELKERDSSISNLTSRLTIVENSRVSLFSASSFFKCFK
jgi:hypothetical protein